MRFRNRWAILGVLAFAGLALPAASHAQERDPAVLAQIQEMLNQGNAHYQAKEYEKALETARQSVHQSESYPYGHRALCSALAMLGRLDEAKAALARFLELSPGYSVESASTSQPFRDEQDAEHYFEGLRRAGWTG